MSVLGDTNLHTAKGSILCYTDFTPKNTPRTGPHAAHTSLGICYKSKGVPGPQPLDSAGPSTGPSLQWQQLYKGPKS